MSASVQPLRWTWTDSWRLETRAYAWLVLCTTPATTVLTFLVTQLSAPASGVVPLSGAGDVVAWGGLVLLWALGLSVVVAVAALGGVVVSLPFTQLLGIAMRRVRPAWAQVTATALLAGVLGAASTLFWLGPLVALPLSVATGAAGAIARSEEFRRRRATSTDAPTGARADGAAAAPASPSPSPSPSATPPATTDEVTATDSDAAAGRPRGQPPRPSSDSTSSRSS